MNLRKKLQQKELPVGTLVVTVYGDGKLLAMKREDDGMYKVQLNNNCNSNSSSSNSSNSNMILYTTLVRRKRTPEELAIAYESLETMRKMNLEVQCNEMGIECNHTCCTICLLDSKFVINNKGQGRLFKRSTQNKHKRSSFKKASYQCLICAAPTCKEHISVIFKKENIIVCTKCEKYFEDFHLQDCIDDIHILQQRIELLMDIYDRVLLLLRYSSTMIPELIIQLETISARDDYVGLGASTGNMLSSALGLAGMATLLTPAGPPLLVAGLLMGVSSTSVSLGRDVVRNNDKTRKIADRILVIHGMMHSILMAADDLRAYLVKDSMLMFHELPDSLKQTHKKYVGKLSSRGFSFGRTVTNSITLGSSAGFTSGTAAYSSLMTAVPFLGPTLAVTCFTIDAHSAKNTIQRIHNGSPCDKAAQLRAIYSDLNSIKLPNTEELDDEFYNLLQAVNIRRKIRVADGTIQPTLSENGEIIDDDTTTCNSNDDIDIVSINNELDNILDDYDKLFIESTTSNNSPRREKRSK